ncbi:AraC family transcriptional regulator [Enterococcus innesii]|uniref:AraC family transcriptional regulator n=1 Tax=Enterococcus innesii TaxID=2839759 RepID=A0ABN6NWL5_9ENTE|nr:AraC family transcriptional regulator [Enterococcus innesii]BDG69606.1 AraC family transcriptional regulator [Enterococcus innesii]
MDWLKGMNEVIEYIEKNLTEPIDLQTLATILGCSVYEFSRIFSFMTEISISEYIRRRRLSQAVFDIQKSDTKMIDIALKYCYESPAAFSRAFKELHGTTPTSVRTSNVSVKTYPPIHFLLSIKGVSDMAFRIEEKEKFEIIGLSGVISDEVTAGVHTVWYEFYESYYEQMVQNFQAPYWQVAAYDFHPIKNDLSIIIGAEYKNEFSLKETLSIKTIPASSWAVFEIDGCIDGTRDKAYTRILTEWFPTSHYRRNEDLPNLEVFPGDTQERISNWEIWMPILPKEIV